MSKKWNLLVVHLDSQRLNKHKLMIMKKKREYLHISTVMKLLLWEVYMRQQLFQVCLEQES